MGQVIIISDKKYWQEAKQNLIKLIENYEELHHLLEDKEEGDLGGCFLFDDDMEELPSGESE